MLTHHSPLSNPLWFEHSCAVLLKAVSVRPMGGHNAVETGASRLEALLLCLVVTFDQAHELTHAVP